MELIVIAGLCCIALCILCFDLLEMAVRRVLLCLLLIFAALIFGVVYFAVGFYQGITQDKTQTKERAEKIARIGEKLWIAYVKSWSIPAKIVMIEPHIKHAVKSGLKDAVSFRNWTKRTQFNPNHPYSALHPARSFVKALPYIMHKYSQRAQGKKPLDPSKIHNFWDIMP